MIEDSSLNDIAMPDKLADDTHSNTSDTNGDERIKQQESESSFVGNRYSCRIDRT